MSKLLRLLFLALTGAAPLFAQTPIGGVISTNTTLTLAGSPYVLTSNLLVQSSITLTIDPGVVVRCMDNKLIQVNGTLRAIGTANAPIRFERDPLATANWGGFRFMNSSVDYDTANGTGCIISHAVLRDISRTLINSSFYTEIVYCELASPMLEHMDIACCEGGVLFELSSAIFRNNIVHDNSNMNVYVNPYTLSNNYLPIIEDNHFYNIAFSNFPNCFLDLRGPCLFRRNCVHDINVQMVVRIRYNGVKFINNTIYDCPEVAVGMFGGSDTSVVIRSNTFYSNYIHLVFSACGRTPVIDNNNFGSFQHRLIVCSTYYYPFANDDCPNANVGFVMNFQGNYWNNLSNTQLDAAIDDFNDDFLDLLDIDYSNPLTSVPVTQPVTACNMLVNGCSGMGIASNASNVKPFAVWPNPATGGNVQFSLPENGTYSIGIYDAAGRMLATQSGSGKLNDPCALSCSGLLPGMYFIRLCTSKQTYNSTLVIQ
jgi:hypothetical protein